jgi:hypothetical protein
LVFDFFSFFVGFLFYICSLFSRFCVGLAEEIYNQCKDNLTKIQMAFMLGRHQLYIPDEENKAMINNSLLSEYFLALGKDLDVMEAKEPEGMLKFIVLMFSCVLFVLK